MKRMGTQHSFGKDMYIISTLLDKLSQASRDKWNEFAEEQETAVVKGVNEWKVFRSWLKKGYNLAKRSRIDAIP